MSRLCMKGVLQPHFMHRSSFFLQHPHLPLMTSKYKNLESLYAHAASAHYRIQDEK